MSSPPEGARRYPQIMRALAQTPWAILPSTYGAICELIAARLDGVVLSAEEVAERISAGPGSRAPYEAGTGVAVVPIYGSIFPRANLMTQISGGTSLQQVNAVLDQIAADASIGTVLFDVNSPGGSVDLVPETAARIASLRADKRVVAVANTMAASAAYWLASQADEIVVTPSGSVGSIGVLAAHEDISSQQQQEGIATTLVSAGRYKTELSPYAPLSEDARAAMQAMVDDFYGMFVRAVAKGRGVTPDAVRAGFGEGRMVGAKSAVSEGMADRVDTFDATLARLLRRPGRPQRAAAAQIEPITTVADLQEVPLELASGDDATDAAASTAEGPEPSSTEQLLAQIHDTVVNTTTRLEEATQ